MLYLVAILLPPLAVLIAGKPIQAVLNVFLTLALYVPGLLHALLVVHNHYADRRTDRMIAAMGGAPERVSRWGLPPKAPPDLKRLGQWTARESGWGGFRTGAHVGLGVTAKDLLLFHRDEWERYTGQHWPVANLEAGMDGPGVRVIREKGKLLAVFDPGDDADPSRLIAAISGEGSAPTHTS